MSEVFNFCAGPAMLPHAVMQQAQQEFTNWNQLGRSAMEISHRSPEFMALAKQAEHDLRLLMSIPENYHVLFMHGGGRGQFSAVPLNLAEQGQQADYLLSGHWARSALNEAHKFVSPQVVGEYQTTAEGCIRLPTQSELTLSDNPAYLHYCTNETIEGLALPYIPECGDVPLVADMSSDILSKPLDVSRYGVIYAGAQKNIGPSGMAVVIIRDDLLNAKRDAIPCTLDYALNHQHQSMFNTPPTYAWYLASLVFKWLLEQGGVDAMAKRNAEKSRILYELIDGSDFYVNRVATPCRSMMNVPFQLMQPELDSAFLTQAEAQGLCALKGHKAVGGMRASIYNAMPLDGVQRLADFMRDFEKRYG